jgi:cytochrome o ubiquinol oxidase subunit 2
MNTKVKVVILFVVFTVLALVLTAIVNNLPIGIMHPKGMIARREWELIMLTGGMGLAVVIPVILLAYFIVWKYRDNAATAYVPEMQTNPLFQSIWWGIPSLIVVVLLVIMWNAAHELDPHKPIATNIRPITIQVISLRWKWLFIYPEQNIATVNYIAFPEKTPVSFELTSDAPMNSFWIPQLNGQIYSMAGMTTRTHLIADGQGEFTGRAAEISGPGFAGMTFITKTTSKQDFENWVQSVKQSPQSLDMQTYSRLARPSEYTPRSVYASVDKDLYNKIIMKFMLPRADATHNAESAMPDMKM